MLDAQAVTPLYVQLMNNIEENINNRVFLPGEKLKSESEMAKEYGVSIITVRNAIGALIKKGLVERKQGKGTFISKPKYTRNIKKLQSFSDMCHQMGVVPGAKTLENKLIIPDEKISKMLEIPTGTQIVFISRVRYADNEPIAIENNYFSPKYSFLLGEKFDNNSLFEFIKKKLRTSVAVSTSEKRIEICKANQKEADLLNVKRNSSMLFVKSIAYDNDNEPMYVGIQIINGERFSLYVYESAND